MINSVTFLVYVTYFSYLAIFEKIFFMKKYGSLIKYASFELLDHHHELNQKKLILKDFFMFKIDSPMLKLWSIPFFSCIFCPFSTFVDSRFQSHRPEDQTYVWQCPNCGLNAQYLVLALLRP